MANALCSVKAGQLSYSARRLAFAASLGLLLSYVMRGLGQYTLHSVIAGKCSVTSAILKK